MALQYPKGKFISIVKVGDKGQIVIPKGARELFGIQPGDQLLLMADKKRGIAPGTKGEDVPEDFECPVCYVGKDQFSEADE